MRVLEVGPWDFPAEGYLVDPSLTEYVGVDLGVWEGSKEGNRADEVFHSALARNGLDGSNASFFRMPASAYGDVGFDVVYLANVFGDPVAFIKNSDNTFKHPGEEDRTLAEALERLVSQDGKVQIVETYTPMKRDLLLDALGSAGLNLEELVEGDDLMDFLRSMYPSDWLGRFGMEKRLEPTCRLLNALRHGIEQGVDRPYMAILGK